MDTGDGTMLSSAPSLPYDVIERIARHVESHADALALALACKSALYIARR